jgi:hypothetical protein
MLMVDGKVYRHSFNSELHAAYYYDILSKKYFGIDHISFNNIPKPDDFTGPNINLRSTKKIPTGVVYRAKYKKYCAGISINKKYSQIGSYDTLEEAVISRKKAEIKRDADIKQKQHEIGMNIIRNNEGIAVIIIKKKDHAIQVLIDDDMFYNFVNYTWRIGKGYAIKSRDNFRMHTIVAELKLGLNPDPINFVIDHINKNKLDNRSCNLRYSTSTENGHNRTKRTNTTSNYIGVRKVNETSWTAGISYNYKYNHLGTYNCEYLAAESYNKKAIELYGDKANLNVIIIPDEYTHPLI